jgi:U2-associated protein SR140
VQPPQDLKTLKLIHRTIETLLTHGTEFEALLMSKDEVRQDPKFSWLWDARSQAGVYYRWKLWEIVTGYSIDKPYTPTVDIFDSTGAVWIPPKKPLKYEWAGSLTDVVEDYEFRSDELDEDDSDHDSHTHNDDRPIGLAGGDGKKVKGYLGVLERAKLIHLISRVPTTTSKVRRGDIGRVMAFAMEHAEGGMGEEVVEILVSNVLKPLAFTKAAKPDSPSDSESEREKEEEKPDTSSAKIVALWIISDVLSNSSLGVRAAWRYRQLFDTALREKKVFARLGEIYRESGWGRMKAEKFRRMVVEGVLEGWEVYPPQFPQNNPIIRLTWT